MIQEGSATKIMYMIVDGQCNIVCKDTGNKFKDLQYEDDPTREKREKELAKLKNPFKRETVHD